MYMQKKKIFSHLFDTRKNSFQDLRLKRNDMFYDQNTKNVLPNQTFDIIFNIKTAQNLIHKQPFNIFMTVFYNFVRGN